MPGERVNRYTLVLPLPQVWSRRSRVHCRRPEEKLLEVLPGGAQGVSLPKPGTKVSTLHVRKKI